MRIVPPIAAAKAMAKTTPETYARLVKTLGSISGVRPERLRSTW